MSEAFEEPGFDMGQPPAPAPSPPARPAKPSGAEAYRVLARKYRPQKFSELIGQDAMVQTLANAIKRDRLAHAFLMTGVRGVGKTTTARLIAKALNCIGSDGKGGPTIDPCNACEPCVAIAEGRHIDVVEMDAASNTGVDDVREIIEAVRYSAVSARYKVYIIDEVHMLTKNAFNALLKTLEEPPPHVKFLFATTEINKVPVTVLSRCQRFDLRRIPADQLTAHFANVVKAEGIEAEAEALALVARAAEGSVRDGLSILDQAIAHADLDGGGRVSADQVRGMLGLSDRGAIRRLAGQILAADGPAVLAALAEQHVLGVEPLAVINGLMETVHGITRAKVGAPFDPSQSAEEREAIEGWSAGLSFILLHRLWQMLLKGHQEVARASDPQTAAEMALLRLVHASSLPDPAELARTIAGGGAIMLPQRAGPSAAAAAAPVSTLAELTIPAGYPALVDALEAGGKLVLADQLRREFGLVRYEPPALVLRPLKPQSDPQFVTKLNLALRDVLGEEWRAEFSDSASALSLAEQDAKAQEELRAAVLATPLVAATIEAFPEAELVGYEGDPRSAQA
jgi:DNA polymerase III subunit gamma/tau